MTDSLPTAHPIAAASHASLRLIVSTTGLLSLSQLLALQSELRTTLVAVQGQIRTKISSPLIGAVIDLTEQDSSSEGEVEDEPNYATAEDTSSGSESEHGLHCARAGIPGLYPMTPPFMCKEPKYWYVVDRGLEVGIFFNKRCVDFVVSSVPGGHRVRLTSWIEAAALYNDLYLKGKIVRVHC